MFDVFRLGVAVQTAAVRTGWEGWPFSGVGSPWLAGFFRILFVACIFWGIAWLLRKLFGPGGRLRPGEFGTEHIEERRRRKKQAVDLRRRWKTGEISDDAYDEAVKRLWNDQR